MYAIRSYYEQEKSEQKKDKRRGHLLPKIGKDDQGDGDPPYQVAVPTEGREGEDGPYPGQEELQPDAELNTPDDGSGNEGKEPAGARNNFV